MLQVRSITNQLWKQPITTFQPDDGYDTSVILKNALACYSQRNSLLTKITYSILLTSLTSDGIIATVFVYFQE